MEWPSFRTTLHQWPFNPTVLTALSLEENHHRCIRFSDPYLCAPRVWSWLMLWCGRWFTPNSRSHTSRLKEKKKINVLRDFGALSSSVGFVVVILKCPLEKGFIGGPAPDRRCIICLAPRRTPPLTGLEGLPTPGCECALLFWTLDSRYLDWEWLNQCFAITIKITTENNKLRERYYLRPLWHLTKHFVCNSHQRTLYRISRLSGTKRGGW